MPNHVKIFHERLLELFEKKAAEFSKYAEEEPKTAIVTSQLAGLYKDLADAITH